MGHVKLIIIAKGTAEDLQRWKDLKMEEPKCWNSFCLGCYDQSDVSAVFVKKEGSSILYLTTLCDDCMDEYFHNDIVVDEEYLLII